MLIGPDGGLHDEVRADIAARGLDHAITLTGPLTSAEIASHAARASFYVQTSHYEGMALSVMEAMQAGLVPVITPAGEIARYTTDGENAVWIPPEASPDDDLATVERILDLIAHPDTWREIRAQGTARLDDMPLYTDDIMAAAADVLNVDGEPA